MHPLPLVERVTHREALPAPSALAGDELAAALRDGRSLRVHSIFATNQGEGAWIGKRAAFIRLMGCSVGCTWCDTEYDTGAALDVEDVVAQARAIVPPGAIAVITGGEPTDQELGPLVRGLQAQGLRAHLETAGVRPVTAPFDWITVSPKRSFERTLQRSGGELKLVAAYPPDDAVRLERYARPFLDLAFEHFWIQPLESPPGAFNTAVCLELTRLDPRWRLSVQAHKVWRIP